MTLVCVDVVGFTKMTLRFGDRRSLSIMRRVTTLITAQTSAWDGERLEVRGDSFLIAFATPGTAVRCAAGIQRELARDAGSHPDEEVQVRIAIHAGPVLRQEGHLFGLNLIVPFRVLSATRAGEISITAAARMQLPADASLRLGPERSFLPKGFTDRLRIQCVDWRGDAPPGRSRRFVPLRLPENASADLALASGALA